MPPSGEGGGGGERVGLPSVVYNFLHTRFLEGIYEGVMSGFYEIHTLLNTKYSREKIWHLHEKNPQDLVLYSYAGR